MAGKNTKPQAKDAQGYSQLPDPIELDGFWVKEEGNVLEGAIMSRTEGRFGFYYVIKTKSPCKVKPLEEGAKPGAKPFTAPAGSNVGVSETAKLRPLAQLMEEGPTGVRITVRGEREDGKGKILDVGVRPAF
jgi:hypothetical protein